MPDIPCIVCSQPLNGHEQQTCTWCVTRARRNLIDIEQDYLLLELEMLGRAGAATPPDPTGVRAENGHMPGGNIMTMLAGGSAGWKSDSVDDDVDSILGVLERYDRDWRITFGELAATDNPTVPRVVLYLLRHLAKAAAEHPTFDEFHAHVQEMRQWLTFALRDGPQYSDVPCIHEHYDKQGHRLRTLEPMPPLPNGKVYEYRCSRCHTTYTDAQFWQAARANLGGTT